MNLSKAFVLFCLIISPAVAFPAPLPSDVFADFVQDGPSKENVVVKRRIFEDNADRQLKQISLSSLVGDLEKNIFASALSLNKVLTNKNVSLQEITIKNDSEHDINNKHQSFTKQERNSESAAIIATTTTTESSDSLSVTDKVSLETTKKVPQANVEPTRIVIDRISIQPHTGGVALIPIFELKQTVMDKDANKDHEVTKLIISKTEITTLATATPDSSSISSTTNISTSNSTTAKSTTTTTEAAFKSVTTPKNIETLKEAEEELREKFAEIEAEPIILSARV